MSIEIFFSCGATSTTGPGPPRFRSFTITLNLVHHSRQDYPGRVLSPTFTPLPDNAQHSHPCPIGIRNRNASERVAQNHTLDRATTTIARLKYDQS